MFTLNLRGRLLTIERPLVMGILNVNSDSFYAGSRVPEVAACVDRAARMLEEGADILDIGGQSTRPGSVRVGASEEADRVLPVVEAILGVVPGAVLSIDTYHASVAKGAVASGVSMVNDVSAGLMDQAMIQTVAGLATPYICMHMQGTPETMQDAPMYGDVVAEVFDHLSARLRACREAGIKDVIIDPGIGFGKTVRHNFRLLSELSLYRHLGVPVMIGVSRKSMVWRTLGIGPEEALNGTSALHAVALMRGADILRVHDVRAAVEVRELISLIDSEG